MTINEKIYSNEGLSTANRRTILGVGGAVGLAALSPISLFAQTADANTLKVGFISPRSGRLAGFGESDGYVLEQARAALKMD